MNKRCRTIVWVLIALCALEVQASEWQFDDVDRVVALSDVHGAYDAMLRTLQNAGVVSADLAWAGGATHLVIVGDLLDRGPDSRPAMDLLMALEGQAAAAGGKVHVLIGNHEAMNLTGDLRYVSREEYAAFANEETVAERERWFKHHAARRGGLDSDAAHAEALAAFDEKYPPGFFAHRRAFASDGIYGKWLLSKPVIVVINGTAFVHGGLSPMISELGLEGVNGGLRQDLVGYVEALQVLYDAGVLSPIDSWHDHDRILEAYMPGLNTSETVIAAVKAALKLGQSDLHASNGPLWYRGNVACSRIIGEDGLVAALQAIGAERVVIGHTPTPGRQVLQRMGGRVVEVDTGMLNSYYDGRGSALILAGDSVGVVTEASAEIVPPAPHPRRVGARPDGVMTAEALESLLRTGDIQAVTAADSGRTIVTLSDGEHDVDALFAERQGKGVYPDVAAYRLDQLLELGLVPVAVMREVDGKDGSLQFLPRRWLDETQRAADGSGASAQCALDRQWSAMYVFDTLIYNEARSLQRMLYSPDIWQLLLVGHDRAFATKKGRPRHLVQVPLQLGNAWQAALSRLDEDLLEKQLGDVLDKRRRKALLARRDQLLQ